MDQLKLYKQMWVPEGEIHHLAQLSQEEITSYLNRGGLVVKNPYDFDCGEQSSYWYVIKDSYGGIDELSAKMRNQVRKSLKTYEVELIDRECFLSIALDIFNKALAAYKVKAKPMDEETFTRTCDGWGNNAEFWCAYQKEGHIHVAVAVNGIFEESVQYWVLKADPAYLHNSSYPYYGLIHTMNDYYLNQKGKRYVSDGARTLTLHSNIQDFLIEKFNFRKAYCRLQVEWAFWFKPIIKVLYPFRKWIKPTQVRALLNLEMMNRGVAK